MDKAEAFNLFCFIALLLFFTIAAAFSIFFIKDKNTLKERIKKGKPTLRFGGLFVTEIKESKNSSWQKFIWQGHYYLGNAANAEDTVMLEITKQQYDAEI